MATSARWYNAVWRWHFYAGLFCMPFVLWLATTGTIYLWKPQIEAWLERPYDTLTPSGPRASADAQVKVALAAVPGAVLHKYQLPQAPGEAARVILGRDGRETRVYVDPYRLRVLRTETESERPMRVISDLHGTFRAGNPGSWLVEIAACWTVTMLLTGLYLWWPRRTRGLGGVLYPRLRGGKRLFWRDLHVVGGYGLFGVILSATLDVVPNDIYRSERSLIDYRAFPETFAAIAGDPAIGLSYVHLSTAPGSLLREAIVYRYRRVAADQLLPRAPLSEVASTKLRRLTINLSKRGDSFKSLKWWSEKNLEHRFESCTVTRAQAMGDGEACLVSRNDPMHDSVAYLRNSLPAETDILHEYFVPRDRIVPFIDGMRALFREQKVNLVNASIRAVGVEANALSYAPKPAFSVVLYITQSTDAAGTERMRSLTSDLIDLTAREGGRFFLPYQLHYTPQQLVRAYPEIRGFFAAKRQWDPDGLFSNTWYARYAPALG